MTAHTIGSSEQRIAGVVLGVADWLRLAAAPTFAVMALVTIAFGGSPPMLCAAGVDTSPMRGMVPMYLLMSLFHLTPWLKLFAGLRRVRAAE